jgi:tyrosine-protein phosphatase YwqE
VIDQDPTSFVDVHSHLVPGVDDGARTVDDTLDAVRRMTKVGIRKILTTPHLAGSLTQDPESLENRLRAVSEAFAEAAVAVGQHFPQVEFMHGHEVMIDVPDPDLSDSRVRLAGTSFVLVEWPRLHLPPRTVPVLERILSQGHRPIIAHPERYGGMDLETAAQWRSMGAYLQVNYGSFVGRYGREPRMLAMRLIRRGWVDYLASDFHARPDMRIYKKEAWKRLCDLGAEEALAYLCLTNPARLLRNEPPLAVPPLPPERGFWARMKEILNLESV